MPEVGGQPVEVEERSLAELARDLSEGRATSADLVHAYQARVAAIDQAGPALRSVIALNPAAEADAAARDAERAAGKPCGPLHGLPILVKDNIETADPTPTTAGSLALIENVSGVDAPIVRRLREAGAVILGKANLSEWANIRSSRSISGWSAIGGLSRNPYALDRSPGGSSSGTGSAIAASLAAAGIGTETDGSIVCPSSFAGLVGVKPTVGVLSRSRIVPISSSQDTPGPMTRCVADAALLLSVMAGSDPADPATAEADARSVDYVAALAGANLTGKRLGAPAFAIAIGPAAERAFAAACDLLRAEGAEIVEVAFEPPTSLGEAERLVLLTELKAGLDAYLAATPGQVASRRFADVLAFNRSEPRELVLFGQELFERAEAVLGLDDEEYRKARAFSLKAAREDGLDKMLDEHRLDAIVAPSFGPSPRIDAVAEGRPVGGRACQLPAIAGYPHLTLPMGESFGLPIGLSFIGRAWSEAALLALGFAFERAAGARRRPEYRPSVEEGLLFGGPFAPWQGAPPTRT